MEIDDIIVASSGRVLRSAVMQLREDKPDEMYMTVIGPGKELILLNMAKTIKFKAYYEVLKGVNIYGDIRNVYLNRDYNSDGNLKATEVMRFREGSLSENDEKKLEEFRIKAIIAAKKMRRRYMFER